MTTSNTLIKIAPALLNAQKKIGSAKKDAKNPFFKSNYADLGSVMEACKDALNENGITVLQPVGTDEQGFVYVETILLHESGEFISDKMRIEMKEQNNPQAQGSAITYARRYSLQSLVFIPAEDDDGNKAVGNTDKPNYSTYKQNTHVTSQASLQGDYTTPEDKTPLTPLSLPLDMTTDPYKGWSLGKLKVEVSALMNKGLLPKDFAGLSSMTRQELIDLLENPAQKGEKA